MAIILSPQNNFIVLTPLEVGCPKAAETPCQKRQGKPLTGLTFDFAKT